VGEGHWQAHSLSSRGYIAFFSVDFPFYSFNILRMVVNETQESDPLEVTVDPYGEIPLEI
jgi:hypothetical protein